MGCMTCAVIMASAGGDRPPLRPGFIRHVRFPLHARMAPGQHLTVTFSRSMAGVSAVHITLHMEWHVIPCTYYSGGQPQQICIRFPRQQAGAADEAIGQAVREQEVESHRLAEEQHRKNLIRTTLSSIQLPQVKCLEVCG